MGYKEAYKNYKGTKGLYYADQHTIFRRNELINKWRKHFITNLNHTEIKAPVLVPTALLELSGHLNSFEKTELLKIEGKDLYLRPETCTSIFPHLREIKLAHKGATLGIGQIGSSFRAEKSTRSSKMRKTEFEQLELEVMFRKEASSEEQIIFYEKHLLAFFEELGIKVNKVLPQEKPHYSLLTYDFYAKNKEEIEYELAALSLRTDCQNYGYKDYLILQISIGLDRLLQITC